MNPRIHSYVWLCLGVVLSGICFPSFCQHESIALDSLKRQLFIHPEDTSKVGLYIEIGQQYEGDQPDSALYYYEQAGELSKKLDYPAGQISYIANYTQLLNYQGKYDQALALNLLAVDIASKNDLKLQLAKSYVNVAVSYQYKAQFETCLQYYLKAIPIFEELSFDTGLYILYANLCALYGQTLEEYDKGLAYGDRAIRLARKQGNLYGEASAQINNGVVFTKMKNYTQALRVTDEGYMIAKQINSLYLQKTALVNTADIYLAQRQYKKVILLATQALELSKTLSDIEGEALSLGSLAWAYLHEKNYLKAKRFASQAVALCRVHQLIDELGKKLVQLAQIELALGNLDAYDMLKAEGDSLEKAILNASLRQNLQELETKYATAQKENKIKQLEKEKQIGELTIRQKNIMVSIFIGTTLSLLAFGLLFYHNACNQKTILHQTHKLQEQRIRELEQVQQLLAVHAMLQGQEAERSRLAKDLHDGLGGMLSGIKLLFGEIKSNLTLTDQESSDFSRALQQLNSTITELRRVAHHMMPEALVRFGLIRALQEYCHDLSKSASLAIDIQAFGMEDRLDEETEVILYRVVQESLNNVVKHAEATEVLLQLIQTGDHVSLTLEDNGKGFNLGQTNTGIGLKNIRSRIQYLGGQLDIQSTAGIGTTITIDFYLQKSIVSV